MNNNSGIFIAPISQITINVDNETLAVFKAHAEKIGVNYQTLINEALKHFAGNLTIVDMLEETIKQEDA